MNRIIYRLAELNDNKITQNEYFNNKKLTMKGIQLKKQLQEPILARLKSIAEAFKRINKNIPVTSLWNNIKLSVNQYIQLDISEQEQLDLFKIIVTEIFKENRTIIDPDFVQTTKPKKLPVEFDPTLYIDYQFVPAISSLWNDTTASVTARINFLLKRDNIEDYFINQYNFNDETLKNICAIYKIKKPNEAYLNKLKEFLINKLNKEISDFIKDKNLIEELKQNIFQKLLRIIKTRLSKILPMIEFPKAPNMGGKLFAHSWLGQGPMDSRKDANPIFKKLGQDENFANEICSIGGININDFKEACNITNWNEYINIYWQKNYDENLHIKVRNYLVDYNTNILSEESQNLISRNIQINKTTNIDYNPRKDQYRERPFIIIRQYNPDTYQFMKDLVLIGDIGANHASILFKKENQSIVNLNNKINNNSLFWSCGYIIGNIAFIALADQKNQEPNNTYLLENIYTPQQLAKLIKSQQPSIQQVFTIPYNNSGGEITRLAKKIHI